MKPTATYQVVAYTDPYHGSREFGFKRYNDTTYRRVFEKGLSLKEAQSILLRYFCDSAGCYFENWGIACSYKREPGLVAYPTAQDGTRFFRDDVFRYMIEIEE